MVLSFGDPNQTWNYNVGYIQKWSGQPGYRIRTHNVSDDQLLAARDHYGKSKQLFGNAVIAIKKDNIFYLADKWLARAVPDLPNPLIGTTIRWMLQSGVYSLGPGWVCGANGWPISRSASAALWRLARDAKNATD